MVRRPARSFFRRDPVALARALLGQRLVRVLDDGRRLAGTIVETEAYLGLNDAAAHTYRGRRTTRNASMWLDGGHTYVYFTYGMHYCCNVVAQTPGRPTAVLLRAIEPTEGLDLMFERRPAAKHPQNPRNLCSGPAKLCAALDIDRNLDGEDLQTSSRLFIEQLRARTLPAAAIAVSPRIGVDYAGAWAQKPLRFFCRDNLYVSRFTPHPKSG
ncbi:MAG: DNA-3-methyladenine glycosylase [Phycisphaeraceae bacterium]|nr:DNA-3-methyladenine glycosylase [Phycisphaeraceae bacterium]